MTADTGQFLAAAGEFLRAEPARNSVMLTVTEELRVKAATQAQAAQLPVAAAQAASQLPPGGQGVGQPLFGWWRPDDGPVGAAFMHTPGFPVMLSRVCASSAAGLAGDLAAVGRLLDGVNAAEDAADAFAAAWRERTGDTVTVYRRMRLFRLGDLIAPAPAPTGTARLAAETDRDLLARWFEAFTREVRDPPGRDHYGAVDDRLGYGGLTVWEVGDVPVSIAGLTRAVAGMVRVGPVYTPPDLRGRGYAGAATAAVSQAALDAGVRDVVLYTDLANPTSNALYQRLGYLPMEDRVLLSFEPAVKHAPVRDPASS